MPKKCSLPGCSNNQFGGGYCLYHQWKRTNVVKRNVLRFHQMAKKKPAKKRLNPFSEKRRAVNVTYSQRARIFREANPVCAIRSPVCIHETQGVHHVKGKETVKKLMDEKDWLPACNPCNSYIEGHTAWAKEHGFKKSKFKP